MKETYKCSRIIKLRTLDNYDSGLASSFDEIYDTAVDIEAPTLQGLIKAIEQELNSTYGDVSIKEVSLPVEQDPRKINRIEFFEMNFGFLIVRYPLLAQVREQVTTIVLTEFAQRFAAEEHLS